MRAQIGVWLLAGLLLAGGARPSVVQQGEPRAASRSPHAAGRAPQVARAGIEMLGAELDQAVDRVSAPHPARLLGRELARGYRLPGYGVVFVLAPRALPGAGNLLLRFGAPRRQLHVRVRAGSGPDESGEPEPLESLERQVIVLQHEAEQTRRAAEEDQERIVHELRVRLGAAEGVAEGSGAATPGDAPQAPPATAQAAPAPEAAIPPPPWKFWFETGPERDRRTPADAIADVRRALVQALETHGAQVPGLRPEEFVTVAVDFEPAGLFADELRPEHTLVVRARVADLAARARGAIPSEELQRRVEVIEY